MVIKIEKTKKVLILVLTFFIAMLVIYAIYTNKSKFYNPETVKYSQITINETNNINEIISTYSNNNNKDKFISEIKKVNNLNNLSNESVYGKTLYIPVIKN